MEVLFIHHVKLLLGICHDFIFEDVSDSPNDLVFPFQGFFFLQSLLMTMILMAKSFFLHPINFYVSSGSIRKEQTTLKKGR